MFHLIMSIHEFFRRRHSPKYGHVGAKFFLGGNFIASAAATFDAAAAAAAAAFDDVIAGFEGRGIGRIRIAFRRGNCLGRIHFRRRRRGLRYIIFLQKPLRVCRRIAGGYFRRRVGRLRSPLSRAADEPDYGSISQSYLKSQK